MRDVILTWCVLVLGGCTCADWPVGEYDVEVPGTGGEVIGEATVTDDGIELVLDGRDSITLVRRGAP